MVGVLKSSFLRRFVGGFVAGVLGVMALQPAEAVPTAPIAVVAQL